MVGARKPGLRSQRQSALVRVVWLLVGLLLLLVQGVAHAQTIESVLSPGDIIEGHVKVEQECDRCHVRFNPKGQDALCMSCHKEVGQDVRQKRGFHGRIKADMLCRSCHTDHKGRKARIVVLDTRKFDHRQTDYLLKGKHLKVACADCHAAGKKYWQAASDCASCHKKDDVHKGGIAQACSTCHVDTGWKETSYDHGKDTGFALKGKHDGLKCDDCHANGRYKQTPKTCLGCHKEDDEHKGRFGGKCETCHVDSAWKQINFNHDTDTDYPLRGKHKKTACNDCHTGTLYVQKLSRQCWDCHKRDDVHKETLGRDCASCHSESSWKDPPKFDHDKTQFPLKGKHTDADCKDCHKSEVYKDAPTACVDCHLKDDKHEGTLGKQCGDCHAERDWKNTSGRFDHDRTRFALRNAHAASTVKCSSCHSGGLKGFRGTATSCFSCHRKDDKHEGTQGQQCGQCHSDKNWKVEAFNHDATRFPLTGGHRKVKCESCHTTPRYKDTRQECVACHRKDDHHKGTLGEQCGTCHGTRLWSGWEFNHDRQTQYPLTGRHVGVSCSQCHKDVSPKGGVASLGQACVDCHQAQDAHDGQFGPRCEKCHQTAGWNKVLP